MNTKDSSFLTTPRGAVKSGIQAAHLCDFSDGEYDIQVNGKRYHFEYHKICGPTVLTKRGDPAVHQPIVFLHAASRWAQQGKRVDESGLCVWDHDPEPILKHLGGRNYKIVGYIEARKGE